MTTLTTRKLAAVVLSTAASIAGALAIAQTGHSSPRSPESFAALVNLPAPAQVPQAVLEFANRAAPVMGVNASALVRRARLLRQNLGERSRSVWAFADDRGRPCYVVSDSGGGCATLDTISPAGLHWSVGGGYPDEPAPFFALADDSIAAVSLLVDGVDVPVSLKNNVAYATYPNTAKIAVITAHYSDGSAQSQRVMLDG